MSNIIEYLSSKPYNERQLLMVYDDQQRQGFEFPFQTKVAYMAGAIGPILLGAGVAPFLPPPLGLIVGFVGPLKGQRMIKASLDDLLRRVNFVTLEQALTLVFPTAHPAVGTLYIGHPRRADTYYPAAQFHRLAFESKFQEAIKILVYLGAKDIDVKHTRGWSVNFSTKADIGKVINAPSIDIHSGFQAHGHYTATLSGHNETALPDDLVWFPCESNWQMIAEQRMRHGLLNFKLTLNYLEDYSINTDLKLKFRLLGFGLGGKFVEHQETTWVISGSFDKLRSRKRNSESMSSSPKHA